MVKNVKSGDEYKVLKQKSKAKKIAWVLSILWIVLAVVPVLDFVYKNSNSLRDFVVIKGVYEANSALMSQYNTMSDDLLKSINVSKYTSKIDIPEIKLDKISGKTDKVAKTANVLSKFGVKGADKVADTSAALQKQVDKINNEIKEKTQSVSKALEQDLNKALRQELKSFGEKQMQKQLQLSDANYKNLLAGRYGIMTDGERKISSSIYAELSKNKSSTVKGVISYINKYYKWISYAILALIVLVGLVPVVIMLKIAKMFTNNFTQCPYCKKIFLSKKAKLGILSKFKFW